MTEVEILKKLISINSVSGNEEEIIKFIPSLIKNKNALIIEVNNNLLIKIKGKNSSKALIFNGHIDTVSPGNLSDWNSNPFEAKEENGNIYGLGAIDMKGSVASLIYLINTIKNNKSDVWFLLVSKEETDGSGTKESIDYLIKRSDFKNYKEVAAIIGEPTGLKNIEIGHKGNAFVHINCIGDTGHGSRPNQIKKNSIIEAYKIIKTINKFQKEMKNKYADKYLGSPSVGLTGIQSESFESANKFSPKCTIQLDIRTNPEFHKNLDKELNNWLKGKNVEWVYSSEPASFGWCSPDEKIIKTLKNIIGKTKIKVSKGSTDQCFFSDAKIPTVVIGPRNGKLCHMANEFIEIEQLTETSELYKKLITEFN